jgi:hypothetical protein
LKGWRVEGLKGWRVEGLKGWRVQEGGEILKILNEFWRFALELKEKRTKEWRESDNFHKLHHSSKNLILDLWAVRRYWTDEKGDGRERRGKKKKREEGKKKRGNEDLPTEISRPVFRKHPDLIPAT